MKTLHVANLSLFCLGQLLLLCGGVQQQNNSATHADLVQVQTALNLDYNSKSWGVASDGTKSYMLLAASFLRGQFRYIIKDLPVFVYDAPTHTDSFIGNRLGNFFEAIACSHAAGLHFVCITNQTDANKLATGFPTIRMHAHPAANISEAIENVQSRCVLKNPYPWENPASLQFMNPSVVREAMVPAMDKFLDEAIHSCQGGNLTLYMDLVNNNAASAASAANATNATLPGACIRYTSLGYVSSASAGVIDIEGNSTQKHVTHGHDKPFPSPHHAHPYHTMMLPLVPSVAILFRCCDILLTKPGADQYGFIRWDRYLQRIPAQGTTTIYILTEPAGYGECPWFATCQALSHALARYLSNHYPQAVVAIRRGHPSDAMVMLSRAPTVICCASSFCLYPAMARTNGTTYLQVSDHEWVSVIAIAMPCALSPLCPFFLVPCPPLPLHCSCTCTLTSAPSLAPA
jgi:hypothetical protein